MNKTAPPGFQKFETESPFNLNVGPYYFREDKNEIVFGLRVQKHHCNTSGRLHGAMVGALGDIALGHSIAKALSSGYILSNTNAEEQERGSMVTLNLTSDYSGTATEGDWLEVYVEVQHVGKSTAFANAYFKNESANIARVSGIYKLFREAKKPT